MSVGRGTGNRFPCNRFAGDEDGDYDMETTPRSELSRKLTGKKKKVTSKKTVWNADACTNLFYENLHSGVHDPDAISCD